MTEIVAVNECDGASLDVVFVHGLNGDARDSWSRTDPDSFWPAWLAEDIADVAVWSVGYDASSNTWLGKAMPVRERAIILLAELQNLDIGRRPLCFITHSTGGLLVKEMLLDAAYERAEYAPFARAAKGVVFLGAPHARFGMAEFVAALGTTYRRIPGAEQLRQSSDLLASLNDRYRDWADRSDIANLIFFETSRTQGVRVVDEVSADPGLAGVRLIPVDENHFDICKPADRGSLVYGQVKSFVRRISEAATGISDGEHEPFTTDPAGDASAAWQVRTRGYADRPPTADFLRREAMIRALADLITPMKVPSSRSSEGDPDQSGPTVIALDGAWGTGKTSLVELVGRQLETTPCPDPSPDRGKRLTARRADRLLRGRPGVPPRDKAIRPAVPDDPSLITAHFQPWAHQTSEQVWAGLTTTVLDAVAKHLLPSQHASTEAYWFRRNLERVDRMRLRRALRKSVLSPMLTVSVLALAAPLVAQMARSTDTYRLVDWVIAGSNIALVIAFTLFLAGILHTVWRFWRRPAADFLPADLFVGPVPSGTKDEAVRDPYHNARSGSLYLAQHDVFKVLEDVRVSGHHIVVFIDDLDRCTPRATAEVFEAINLFVTRTFPVTKFVLCLDTTTVAAHLDEVYASLKGKALHGDDPSPGWSFLRKLIQLPIPIPPAVPGDVPRLLEHLLGSEESRRVVVGASATRHGGRPETAGEPAPSSADGGQSLATSTVSAMIKVLEHHPRVRQRINERLREQRNLSVREVKRMLTIWQYYVRVLSRVDHSDLAEQARHLVILAEIIARWPAAQRTLHRVTDGKNGMELLANAAGDWEWSVAVRDLKLHDPVHGECVDGIRELFARYEGDKVAALAARLV
jgi:hypothetical protein